MQLWCLSAKVNISMQQRKRLALFTVSMQTPYLQAVVIVLCFPSHTHVLRDNIQMTHDHECDMLIYMSQSWNVNMRAMPKCRHFNWGTYIFACHTSPSCIICFLASLNKILLNNIKYLHFTGTEPYGNYVIITSRHVMTVKPRPLLHLSQWALATCSDAWWTRATYFNVTSMRCDLEICHMACDWIYTILVSDVTIINAAIWSVKVA